MRPLYSVLSPRIKSRYARLGDSFKRRLYGNRTNESTEMRSTAQKLGSGDDRDWGLRVPGSQTMKTIDMPLARIDDSRGSESGSISPSERKSNGQVVENWVWGGYEPTGIGCSRLALEIDDGSVHALEYQKSSVGWKGEVTTIPILFPIFFFSSFFAFRDVCVLNFQCNPFPYPFIFMDKMRWGKICN